jgi:hypothetical protein
LLANDPESAPLRRDRFDWNLDARDAGQRRANSGYEPLGIPSKKITVDGLGPFFGCGADKDNLWHNYLLAIQRVRDGAINAVAAVHAALIQTK